MENKTIKIDTETLKSILAKFETAKTELIKFKFTAPQKTGGGLSVEELSAMENDYIAIRDALVSLFDKTQQFMSQSAEDISALDDSIANKMSLGG